MLKKIINFIGLYTRADVDVLVNQAQDEVRIERQKFYLEAIKELQRTGNFLDAQNVFNRWSLLGHHVLTFKQWTLWFVARNMNYRFKV